MIQNKNFANLDPADIPFDTEFVNCNFTQSTPIDSGGGVMVGHQLFPGSTVGVIFRNCNLVNCETPVNAQVENCNTSIINGQVFAFEDITTVDGVEVGRKSYYDHVHYGRWNPATESYDYLPTPVVTPVDY
jgi:hypothetical protein